MNVANKVVIVTGSGKGIGRAIAEEYGKRKAIVIVAEIDASAGQEVEDTIRHHGGQALFIRTDVTNEDSIKQMIKKTTETYGPVDTLVNNAGITIFKPIEDCTLQDWELVMNTDLRSVFLTSKYITGIMKENGGGSIINIASNHVHATLPDTEMYAAAKSGVVGFTKSLALSLGKHGIRVNAVCPGFMDTYHYQNWLSNFDDQAFIQKEVDELHATQKMGNPQEVANVCIFLSSNLVDQMTGSCITLDGGLSTRLYHSKYA
ncbi:SDR family oxidoreductase [Sporosarcina saromensis]|uniref:SDR family oxidoreductase n=1 Tax=Sporosarcina saromensis TaxID=359365 RepID=A0ABU4G7Y3_9BACL|nr:SDR family oxidoreductase [Sporosarcina saromensis]MDW0113086.1 SDR family oxidoreductase [Sporosarcina saromensis]